MNTQPTSVFILSPQLKVLLRRLFATSSISAWLGALSSSSSLASKSCFRCSVSGCSSNQKKHFRLFISQTLIISLVATSGSHMRESERASDRERALGKEREREVEFAADSVHWDHSRSLPSVFFFSLSLHPTATKLTASPFFLFPAAAPRLKPMKNPISVEEGRKLAVKCEATGSPIPSYTWFKDGNQLKKSKKVRIRSNEWVPVTCGNTHTVPDEEERRCLDGRHPRPLNKYICLEDFFNVFVTKVQHRSIFSWHIYLHV